MGFFGMGFSVFRILFAAVFLLVLFVIISNVIRGVGQWSRNNQSPVLNVFATVVARREEVTYRHHPNNTAMGHSCTAYYVTFEVESGDRMEFQVNGSEYGMLIEQDFGSLKFQGTRFLGFERER